MTTTTEATGLITILAEATALRVIKHGLGAFSSRPLEAESSGYLIGRFDGLVEALAHLQGRQADEVRLELLKDAQQSWTRGVPT